MRRAALIAGAALLVAAAPADRPGPARGPASVRTVDGLGSVSSADCESCHADIASEWRASLHRQAFSDDSFQRAFSVEQLAFCQGCHAPEADLATTPSAAAAEEGVGCTTCHVLGGEIAGAHARAAPHAVAAAPWLSGPEACAGCHQFAFPSSAALMQDTHGEHQRSSYAAEACQSCHMLEVPSAGGGSHKSHRFGVRDDAAFMASAIRAEARWAESGVIEISLEADRVGHAVPTGDLFRRLELQAVAIRVSPPELVWARPVRLGREFDQGPEGTTMAELRDGRLGPPGTASASQRHQLKLPPYPDDAVVVWAVVHQRINAPVDGADLVEAEVVIAGGIMP